MEIKGEGKGMTVSEKIRAIRKSQKQTQKQLAKSIEIGLNYIFQKGNKQMNTTDLIKALSKLKVETGSLACFGCVHKDQCSIHGCTILKAAVEKLSGMEWIDASVEVPPDENFVLALAVGKPTANIELVYSCEIASYSDSGWFLEAWPDWDQTVVSHWMPIPELPKVCGQ